MNDKIIVQAFDKTYVNVKTFFFYFFFYTNLRKIFCFAKESKKKPNLIQFMIGFGQILVAVLFFCF